MPNIKVYYSPDSTANILSFKDVTTEYAVDYQRIKDCLTFKLNNDDNNNIMVFKQLNKLYVYKHKNEYCNITTISDNEQLYVCIPNEK